MSSTLQELNSELKRYKTMYDREQRFKMVRERSGISLVLYVEALVEKAKVLDNFYVPTRYPNGHPEGAPFEHYGSLQSKEAIEYAGEILEYCRAQMA